MAAIQLNFTLRTSANVKTVHLLGSWDNYNGQLPLSKDAAKAGGWKGTFRFQGTTLQQGKRYWYYYIIDGYHVSHDPARESVTEPTTGRKLNTLDIPAAKTAPAAAAPAAAPAASNRHSRRASANVPKGRSLSPSQIKSPRPVKPNETRQIVAGAYEPATVEALTSRFSKATMEDSEDDSEDDSDEDDSDNESDVPSLTSRSSRSSNSSSPSSVSSSSSCCTCERYGITRAGDRVKLDCGGARCGYSDDSEECSSEDDEGYQARTTRRQGIVVRR
ncbi:hypothetical protein W97_09094 [Coniosporium apollinis CBS 100218]|uniref:AMP-activated protein kinase glycogen-binding domain-containing protein n=1 Tax=Coniosporium apollinis (strain CBS 100218) TaxID=1168221 RepID=R7Z7C4_CONA1|nr:uncharacterized protein W97_09094 [Coniosporium apollinis CBS 100218]EON69831.1 hypothetical protein W97_09094 [Coniosporium apollinis CBS 100218]